MGVSTFPRAAAYSRCALDRPPVLLPGSPMPPAPRWSSDAGGGFRIFINADGSVDPDLTRAALIVGDDEEAHDRMLATLKQWRFEPGVRAGVPVRSAIDIELRTSGRIADTLPARLEWRYVSGIERDSLLGQWVMEDPLPPFPSEQEDSVYSAMLRRLARMLVVLPTEHRTYCLASADSGAVAEARLGRLARAVAHSIPGLAVGECMDTPERVRLLLPRVYQTENQRAVLYVAGAQLPRWPAGFDARAWARWAGRCVGDVDGQDPVAITCSVSPDVPWEERRSWHEERSRPRPAAWRPRADREPVHLTVLATMTGADGIDTLNTTVRPVPRLRAAAVRDSVGPCNSWSVWTPRDSAAYVVHGDPTERSLRITRANVGPPNHDSPRSRGCGAPSSRADRFVAFLLGGVGERPRDPLTLCVGSCERRYELDPGAHLLAGQPHVRIRVAALREASRNPRGMLRLRLLVDPVPDSLVPLVVIVDPRGDASTAWVPTDLGGGVWDWAVHYSGVDWSTRDALIYLLRR